MKFICCDYDYIEYYVRVMSHPEPWRGPVLRHTILKGELGGSDGDFIAVSVMLKLSICVIHRKT